VAVRLFGELRSIRISLHGRARSIISLANEMIADISSSSLLFYCSDIASRYAANGAANVSAPRLDGSADCESKIEETGTVTCRFLKLLLSAHWLDRRFRHQDFAAKVPWQGGIACFCWPGSGTLG